MQQTSRDDLASCLLIMARQIGKSTTKDALLAGLPIEGRLTPAVFARAAERVGLSAKMAHTPLHDINGLLLPAVLLLADERACVLYGLDVARGVATVVFPEMGAADAQVEISLEDLQGRYTGHVVYCRETFRPDDREGARVEPKGHWFWSVIAQNRRLYRDIWLAAFVINLFAMAMPLFTMNIYDRVVPNRATDTLWVLAAGVVIVLLGDLVLKQMRCWFVDAASARADVQLSAYIMERFLGVQMAQRPASVGSSASTVQGFESVRSFSGSASVLALVDIPFFFLFMVIIAMISLWLVVPLVIGAGIALVYALMVGSKLNKLSEATSQASSQRNASLVEGLYALETLKSFAATGRVQKVWEQCTRYLAHQSGRQRLLGGSVGAVSATVQQISGVVLMIIGVYLLIEGHITQGGLIAAYMLSSRAMAPIAQVASLLSSYYQAKTALTQLNEAVVRPQERPAGKTYISRPRLSGAVALHNVSFAYPGSDVPVVSNLNLSIRKGERVGIIGRVGSGKSTIGKLILGLYAPSEGAVMIDGLNSAQLDPDEMRRNMGYIPQDPMLLHGTVAENILLGAGLDNREAKLAKAIEVSGMAPMLGNSAEGLSQQVGEGGSRLSGGQRQLISVARAVAMDAPILVFDEPTSAMDSNLEARVTQNFAKYVQGRTLVLVTHKPAMLALVDRLVVMDGGKIVADGPKDQVLAKLQANQMAGQSAPQSASQAATVTAIPAAKQPAAQVTA